MATLSNIYLQQTQLFIEFLSKLTTQEIEELTKGTNKITFTLANKPAVTKKLTLGEEKMEILIQALGEMQERADATAFLQINCNKKPELVLLAKRLDLSIQKGDTKEKILQKIVEGTIGFKLRSQAIQQ